MIKQLMERKRKEREELQKKQNKCKHNYDVYQLKITAKAHNNLIGLVAGGVKEVTMETQVRICRICEKEIGPEVDI